MYNFSINKIRVAESFLASWAIRLMETTGEQNERTQSLGNNEI